MTITISTLVPGVSRKGSTACPPIYITAKKGGCFNHRVVTLVAQKLERQWLREVYFGMED